jgi:hypothetical protein
VPLSKLLALSKPCTFLPGWVSWPSELLQRLFRLRGFKQLCQIFALACALKQLIVIPFSSQSNLGTKDDMLSSMAFPLSYRCHQVKRSAEHGCNGLLMKPRATLCAQGLLESSSGQVDISAPEVNSAEVHGSVALSLSQGGRQAAVVSGIQSTQRVVAVIAHGACYFVCRWAMPIPAGATSLPWAPTYFSRSVSGLFCSIEACLPNYQRGNYPFSPLASSKLCFGRGIASGIACQSQG